MLHPPGGGPRRAGADGAALRTRKLVSADLVVRARPEAATATSADLARDLAAGLDRVLTSRVRTP